MVLWIIGIIVAFLIAGVIDSITEYIDSTDWSPWKKKLFKFIIWSITIILMIIAAFFMALLSALASESNKQ